MAECYYEPTPATDGATMNPVPGAVFQVFEIADTTFSTPLSLRVGAGNPTTTVAASESLATLPGVHVTSPNFEHIWVSGSFQWRRDSIDGAKAAIQDAKVAAVDAAASSDSSAQSSADSAQAARDAAALVDAPADTVMAGVAANSGSAFATQLNATITEETAGFATKAEAGGLPALAPLSNIAKTATGPFRIFHAGTSIAAATPSPGHMIIEQLKSIYGDSGIQSYRAGILGGNMTSAYQGWEKQAYGGPFFTRLRGKSTSSSLTVTGSAYFDQVVVQWSREADSGSSDVLVDGAVVGTIGGAGTQAYSQSVTFNVAAGIHTFSITPPASGYTYLEHIEFRLSTRKGVEARNVALGGSLIRDMLYLHPVSGQVAGIPIEGDNGINAHVNRPDIDLFIFQFVVNDAGYTSDPNHFTNTFKTTMDKIVAATAAAAKPLVLIVEMGGHYSMPNDGGSATYHDNYNRIRDYLLGLKSHSHVTVVDWHGATVLPDLNVYQQTYYPAVTNLNVGAGTYSGDFIHPADKGHQAGQALLAKAFGVEPPKFIQPGTVALDRMRVLKPGVGVDQPATVDGTAKFYAAPSGPAYVFNGAGTSSASQGVIESFYRDTAAANGRGDVLNTEIAASATSSEYGKYIDYSLKNIGTGTFIDTASSEKVYLTVKAAGNFLIRADSPVSLHYKGALLPAGGDGRTYVQYNMATTDKPAVFAVQVSATANNGLIYVSGRIYDVAMTKSTVPLLT